MINPTQLAAHVAATRQDEAAAGIAADWLHETGASLAEMLIAYAGHPPWHTDGIPHTILVEWCARMAAHDPAWVALAADVKAIAPNMLWPQLVYRDVQIRAIWVEIQHQHPTWPKGVDSFVRAWCERDHKRRALRLFPDKPTLICRTAAMPAEHWAALGLALDLHVEWTEQEYRGPLHHTSDYVQRLGLRAALDCTMRYRRYEDGLVSVRQCLTAHNLIGPELVEPPRLELRQRRPLRLPEGAEMPSITRPR